MFCLFVLFLLKRKHYLYELPFSLKIIAFSFSSKTHTHTHTMEDTISTVSVKIPQFMHAAVDGWFAICEAQFELGNISNETTRFYHVLSNLPPDLISNLPTTTITSKSYTKLRDGVISMHEQSKPELFNRLIGATTMTGKPSTYRHELMATASKIGVGEELVWHKIHPGAAY